jgi:hypothetical protein
LKISKGLFFLLSIVTLISGLDGCATNLVEMRMGSERVALADESQIAGCKSLGDINVSVLAEVGFINRSVEAVEANLLQLARNGAVDAGGDTVVKGNSPDYGRRTFAIYKCRP